MRTFADSLLRRNDLDDLLWDIAGSVGDLFGYEDCVVYLVEPAGLVQRAAYGVKSPALREIKNRLVLPLGQGIVGTVAVTGVAELVADTRSDRRYIADEFQGHSELAVPIVCGGKVLGVLDSEASCVDGYTAADLATFELIATLAAPRIASALAERELSSALVSLQHVEATQRQRQGQEQRQRLEALGQLAGGIAQDFADLLTSILGNVSMAQEHVAGGPAAPLLHEVVVACDRARALSAQLVGFAAGGAPDLQVRDIVGALRAVVAEELAGSSVEVSWRIGSALPAVAFDDAQMRQVFRHLVRNAREAMSRVGRLAIEVGGGDGPQRSLVVVLHDSGPGVPSPLRTRVFDPYFTTKEGGVGLGLAAAYWIVRRHGGTLALDVEPTQGARFRLTLPAAAAAERAPAPAAPARGLRVLVLDDNPAVRAVLVRMVQSLSHDVVGVGDGVACLREFTAAQAAGRPFQVVFFDLTLRYGIGWEETLGALRQVGAPFAAVVVSGRHDSPVLANPRQHGFAARVAKPFTVHDLDRALAEALGARAGQAPIA